MHVISYALPFRLELVDPRLIYHEVVVPHYPLFEYPPYSLALATKIVEVARHHQLDLIHVHYAVPNAVSAVLARQILEPQELKVVTTLHGTDITLVGNDPNYLETTRWGIERSDAVTAVSESLRRATLEQLGVTEAGSTWCRTSSSRSATSGPAPSPGRAAGRSRARRSWCTSPTSGRSSG